MAALAATGFAAETAGIPSQATGARARRPQKAAKANKEKVGEEAVVEIVQHVEEPDSPGGKKEGGKKVIATRAEVPEDFIGCPAPPSVLKGGRIANYPWKSTSRPVPNILAGYSGRLAPAPPLPRSAGSRPESAPLPEKGQPCAITQQMLSGARLVPAPIPRGKDVRLQDQPPPPGSRPFIDYSAYGCGKAGSGVRLVQPPVEGEARLGAETAIPKGFQPRFSPFPLDGREGQFETPGNEGRPVAAPMPAAGRPRPPTTYYEGATLTWAPLAWRPEHGKDRSLHDFEEPDISDDEIL
eukprot:TRINITY_DN47794_c0_g1_i1.p1 TRINITY_DN47794_c0_g1~~TRINITY_DN47794_c0_g1_i1.p1  ORF type:complete len:297 (+),score=42.89 TRINITY_DN47794_c0_g1_i1:128-1018(+)